MLTKKRKDFIWNNGQQTNNNSNLIPITRKYNGKINIIMTGGKFDSHTAQYFIHHATTTALRKNSVYQDYGKVSIFFPTNLCLAKYFVYMFRYLIRCGPKKPHIIVQLKARNSNCLSPWFMPTF